MYFGMDIGTIHCSSLDLTIVSVLYSSGSYLLDQMLTIQEQILTVQDQTQMIQDQSLMSQDQILMTQGQTLMTQDSSSPGLYDPVVHKGSLEEH